MAVYCDQVSAVRQSFTFNIFDFSSWPLNRIQPNLAGIKISTSSTRFVFFWPMGKTRWPPRHLIGWDIFDFSETTERNSTELERKQDLNVLYQICVFWPSGKNDRPASDWLKHYRLLLWNRWKEFNETCQRTLPSLFLTGRSGKQNGRPGVSLAGIFQLLLWNRWTEFSETWQEARSQLPLPSLCFSGRSEKQNGRPAFDWLRHFRLLLWNCWTE